MIGSRPDEDAAISAKWRRGPDRLSRELHFRDYADALSFASVIGRVEDFGHHPDICITSGSGGRLAVTVRNLNRAGVTEQELRLARKLDAVIDEHYRYAYDAEPAIKMPADGEPRELIAAPAA